MDPKAPARKEDPNVRYAEHIARTLERQLKDDGWDATGRVRDDGSVCLRVVPSPKGDSSQKPIRS